MQVETQTCLVILLACLLVCGCSEPIQNLGSVRFEDGQPVQAGSIEFRSLADGTRYASRINEEGGFELLDADGEAACSPGEYEVVVVQMVLTEDLAANQHSHGRTVPRRFADYYTSGLRASVSGSASDLIKVELPLLPSEQAATAH